MASFAFYFGHNDPLFSSTCPDQVWNPTPPVSPSQNEEKPDEDELDLGLGNLLGEEFDLALLDIDLLMNEDLFTDPMEVVDSKCEVNELRHDCMWAGHCPAEEHRIKKETLPILSTSPPELPLIRPETPHSESDSSSSDSESEQVLPIRIHPVRSKKTSLPDHSYSHSDHSYHTRRPDSIPFMLGLQTPSDSEEEIDVVSLGEVLRVAPVQPKTVDDSTPLRLKLKVTPSYNSGFRKALPEHPSALVRHQLQLAVASAAQRHITPDNTLAQGKLKRGSPRKRGSRTGSDSEDNCEKRSQHNSMERQRRVDLRNAFEFLRSLIPDLETTDRAAKVVILKKAAHFCQGLTQREKQFVADKDALSKRQEMLRKRLALLQRRR